MSEIIFKIGSRPVFMLLAVGLFYISGCTNVRAIVKDKTNGVSKGGIQIPYYLPMGLVTIECKNITKAVAYDEEIQRTVTKKTTSPVERKKSHGDAAVGPDDTAPLADSDIPVQMPVDEGQGESEGAEEENSGTNVDTESTVTKTKRPKVESISQERSLKVSVESIPDESFGRPFYARYSPNIMSDDSVTLSAPKGLLANSKSLSEDKTLVVIENLAAAVIEGFKFGVMPLRSTGLETPKIEAPVAVDITFDPTNSTALKSVNAKLEKWKLKIVPGYDVTNHNPIGQAIDDLRKVDADQNGLLFHPIRYFYVRSTDSESLGRVVATFGVPDRRYVFCVPLKRSAFVSFKTDLTIENGMLLGYSLEKKSEAEAFSGLPLRILQKVTSLPKGLLVYQTDNEKASTGLIKAETERINAEIERERVISARQGERSGR